MLGRGRFWTLRSLHFLKGSGDLDCVGVKPKGSGSRGTEVAVSTDGAASSWSQNTTTVSVFHKVHRVILLHVPFF